MVAVFLMRVSLPDRPGSLGAVASAMGSVGGDINAVEIVEKGDGIVVDDFIVDLPPEPAARDHRDRLPRPATASGSSGSRAIPRAAGCSPTSRRWSG